MTASDAAKILDLPVDATPEQIEARFNELRAKLEDRIAKAPTPGLKAKYRESLDDLTAAFESLTLAADSSSLPLLQRQRTEHGGQRTASDAGGASPRREARSQPAAKKSGGLQFAIVVVIALAVLGAGGWWVMKTRTEDAEKARLATELAQKAAEQKAESERAAAAAAKLAEEEKVRLAAEAKAESARREQLGLQLRTRISELNITLDALLKTESLAERELSDLKAEERSLQREAKGGSTPDLRAAQAALQAYDRYVSWLRDYLAANPARLARAKLDELAGAEAWDEVATALEPYAAAIKQIQADIPAKRDELLVLTGTLHVTAEPAELDFQLQDSYGRLRAGRTPAELTDVPFGSLHLTGVPFPAEFTLTGQGRSESGRTPATLPELPVGHYQITYARAGWASQSGAATVTRGGTASAEASFPPPGTLKVDSKPAGASVTFAGKALGVTPLVVSDLPPGPVSVDLALADYRPAALQGTIEAGKETVLTTALRSATLTPEEAFDKLSRDAQGTWVLDYHNIIAGNQRLYFRFTAGSRTVQLEQTGFGGSVRNLTMVEYDAVNKVVLIAFSGLDALNGKLSLRLEGDSLLYGRGDLTKTFSTLHRE